jgi:small nuclear ribonucleoprotein D3
LELKTGEIYRGQLLEAEDNMNCQMQGITRTGGDGRVTSIERCYIRGSQIRFVIVPDMLKNAPMFKRLEKGKGALGLGRAVGIGRAGQRAPARGRGAGPAPAGGPGRMH